MPDDQKAGEQKTERFNMFMSPSESEAIDEWAWKRRIRSKSEAVRRLCQMGLMLEEALSSSQDSIVAMMEAYRSAKKVLDAIEIEPLTKALDEDHKKDVVGGLKQMETASQEFQDVLGHLAEFFSHLDLLYINVDMDSALSDIAKFRHRRELRRKNAVKKTRE